MENLLDLIYIARKYDILYVVEVLLRALQQRLDVDNAINIYQQAQDFRETVIEEAAFEFIVRLANKQINEIIFVHENFKYI